MPRPPAPPVVADEQVEATWRQVLEADDQRMRLGDELDQKQIMALVKASFRSASRPKGKRLASLGMGAWGSGPIELYVEPHFEEDVELVEVAVPETVSRYHPLVKEFSKDREWSYVSAEAQPRASRVLQAIVNEALHRGYELRAPDVSERQTYRSRTRRDRFAIVTPDGSFTVQIREIPKTGGARLEYPTWNARKTRPSWVEQRGYEFIPTGHLELTLQGVRGYGDATYREARTHQLEDRLGVLFHDLEVSRLYRAHAALERELAKQERARVWEAAMAKAKARFREDARLKHVRALADTARRAEESRSFARAAQAAITSLDADAQVEAQAALELFVTRTNDKDPLLHPELFITAIPEPKPEELKPYLGRWSPYSPDGV